MTTLTVTDLDFKTCNAALDVLQNKFGIGVHNILDRLIHSIRSAEKRNKFGFIENGVRWIFGSADYLGRKIFKRKRSQVFENLKPLIRLRIVLVKKYETDRGWVNAYTIDVRRFLDLYYNDFKEISAEKTSVDKAVNYTVKASFKHGGVVRFPDGGSSGFRTNSSLYIYYPKTKLNLDIIGWETESVDNSDELPHEVPIPSTINEVSNFALKEKDFDLYFSEEETDTKKTDVNHSIFDGSEWLPIDQQPKTIGLRKVFNSLLALMNEREIK